MVFVLAGRMIPRAAFAASWCREVEPMKRDSLRLYLRYLDISLRSQMQYRTSFAFQVLGHFLVTFLEFLAIAAVFQRFGQINGWTLEQMGLFYGIISVAFAIAEAVPRGFDMFPTLIKNGDFDRIPAAEVEAFQILDRISVDESVGSRKGWSFLSGLRNVWK